MTDKKLVIIDRATWKNGSQSNAFYNKFGITKLENMQGFSCCLGFVCRAEGYDTKGGRYYYPSSLGVVIPGLTVKASDLLLNYKDTDLSTQAANINDDEKITNTQREYRLRKLFREHSESRWILSFRGKYPSIN